MAFSEIVGDMLARGAYVGKYTDSYSIATYQKTMRVGGIVEFWEG